MGYSQILKRKAHSFEIQLQPTGDCYEKMFFSFLFGGCYEKMLVVQQSTNYFKKQ